MNNVIVNRQRLLLFSFGTCIMSFLTILSLFSISIRTIGGLVRYRKMNLLLHLRSEQGQPLMCERNANSFYWPVPFKRQVCSESW